VAKVACWPSPQAIAAWPGWSTTTGSAQRDDSPAGGYRARPPREIHDGKAHSPGMVLRTHLHQRVTAVEKGGAYRWRDDDDQRRGSGGAL
jgi:hypothetical protein